MTYTVYKLASLCFRDLLSVNEAFLQDYHDLVISFQSKDVSNMTSSIGYYFLVHYSKIPKLKNNLEQGKYFSPK